MIFLRMFHLSSCDFILVLYFLLDDSWQLVSHEFILFHMVAICSYDFTRVRSFPRSSKDFT